MLEKWNAFNEESKLEKHHRAQLKELLYSEQEEFNARKMCQVLEIINFGEDAVLPSIF